MSLWAPTGGRRRSRPIDHFPSRVTTESRSGRRRGRWRRGLPNVRSTGSDDPARSRANSGVRSEEVTSFAASMIAFPASSRPCAPNRNRSRSQKSDRSDGSRSRHPSSERERPAERRLRRLAIPPDPAKRALTGQQQKCRVSVLCPEEIARVPIGGNWFGGGFESCARANSQPH